MITNTFIYIFLISSTVISQENQNDIVSLLIDDTQQKPNITCLCTEDERCDLGTRTCQLTDPDHACYESWTKEIGSDSVQVTAGCVQMELMLTQIFCNGNLSNLYVICCSDADFCNDRDAYSSDIRMKLLSIGKAKRKFHAFSIKFIIILISIISSTLLLCSSIAFILFHMKRKQRKSSEYDNFKSNKRPGFCIWLFSRTKPATSTVRRDSLQDDASRSSDGCDARLLAPTSFANQVTLEEKIGMGGYGSVYRGKWHQDTIAVKICLSNDEASWRREVYIYEEFRLNHENILRYIAADNTDCSNRIELWLGTEYHENGSVYDYLQTHTITMPIMIKMMFSIANGLFFLHVSIDATNGRPSLAHRDLKTKNILVKKDLSCCIADLGLAVSEVRRKNIDNDEEYTVVDIRPNYRVGTIRYMAPEILDKTFNEKSFDSYKATDLYALGLVYWEILRRCQTTLEENDADIYQLSYEDILPNNPTVGEMYDVVCVKRARPAPSARWEHNSIFTAIFGSCRELWTENPACRPNSYVIREQLRSQQQKLVNQHE